jgi:hypothetical protein
VNPWYKGCTLICEMGNLFDHLEDGGKKSLQNVSNKSSIYTALIFLADLSSKTPCKPQIPPVISTHPSRRILEFQYIQIMCILSKMDFILCNLVRAALYIYMVAGSTRFHLTLKRAPNIQLNAVTHTQGKLCFCSQLFPNSLALHWHAWTSHIALTQQYSIQSN